MPKLLIILLFSLTSKLCIGQTQAEINGEAKNKYLKADKELNIAYQRILKEYQSDLPFIKNFKRAQRLWIEFRDAEMKVKYPDREAGYYGSVQPLCWYNYLTELTEERTKKIQIWLTGIEEGDVCSGSVKTKD